jgi:hypothetical protein
MKITTQLITSAVIFGGALAITALGPKVAHATSCPPWQGCDNLRQCPTSTATCQQHVPPGCTFQSGVCFVQSSCSVLTGYPYAVSCHYQ